MKLRIVITIAMIVLLCVGAVFAAVWFGQVHAQVAVGLFIATGLLALAQLISLFVTPDDDSTDEDRLASMDQALRAMVRRMRQTNDRLSKLEAGQQVAAPTYHEPVAAAGNQAQLGIAEIGAALLSDPRVTALGLHVEGFGDLRQFEALAATARNLAKPIIALKIGRSEQARAATVSHTASLAGGDAGAQAFLDRLGIPRLNSLPELIGSFINRLAFLPARFKDRPQVPG